MAKETWEDIVAAGKQVDARRLLKPLREAPRLIEGKLISTHEKISRRTCLNGTGLFSAGIRDKRDFLYRSEPGRRALEVFGGGNEMLTHTRAAR
jgi:hypothetical protein